MCVCVRGSSTYRHVDLYEHHQTSAPTGVCDTVRVAGRVRGVFCGCVRLRVETLNGRLETLSLSQRDNTAFIGSKSLGRERVCSKTRDFMLKICNQFVCIFTIVVDSRSFLR